MVEQQGIAQEWAEVEQVFPTAGHGRGLVLALRDGFGGIIPTDGTVQGERGASAYTGPTFVEDWDASGAWRGWTAVVATAGDAAQLFRLGDAVAFAPRPDPWDVQRPARVIELDAQDWTRILDFYDALLAAIDAPTWHGRNVNALIDSMIWGGINSVEPPYEVRVRGVRGLAGDVRREIEQAEQAIEGGRSEFLQRRGHDPGTSLRIVS